MTANELFNYARRYADRAERNGRGTEFPTVRQAAKRFRCTQNDILNMMDDAYGEWSYFQLATGFGTDWGYGSFDRPGDYQLEAYR